MSQDKWNDLYDRLSSRKLWLCVVTIALAAYGHFSGHMNYDDFVKAVLAAVATFSIAEGAADAVAAYRPKPATGDTQNVNVGTDVPVVEATTLKAPAARIRPSRAKPKAILTEPVVSRPRG
jgi:hypothetical protein